MALTDEQIRALVLTACAEMWGEAVTKIKDTPEYDQQQWSMFELSEFDATGRWLDWYRRSYDT